MRIIFYLLILSISLPVVNSFAGGASLFYFLNETDTGSRAIYTAFDLRERESYVQVTNTDSSATRIHVQIYNVGNLCNENNFFDVYTPNDTHVYNLRDILTNDGNPSGVDLPEDAYGIVFISALPAAGTPPPFPYTPITGNFRIIDNAGYEYRSNAQGFATGDVIIIFTEFAEATFNYSSSEGVILSDIFGVPISTIETGMGFEASLDNILETFAGMDVDIIDNNEVLFSCRDVIFACVNEDNPLIEELIQTANEVDFGGGGGGGELERTSASVADFEYGINEAIPNSKGGELLCPGNNIPEGIVKLTLESTTNTFGFMGYVGLNNGSGRGSMDSIFSINPRLAEITPTRTAQ